MQGLLDWLQGLPPEALMIAMATLAAAENMFPPLPADVAVAFGAFLLSRGQHSEALAAAVVWFGNVAGAASMYLLGRRYGAAAIERRFRLTTRDPAEGDARIVRWHSRYGTAAFFLSRFVPGVRSLVPPLAGALRVPMPRTLLAIAASSGIWYGLIVWFAFRAGENWDALAARVGRAGRVTALGAAGILVIVAVTWYWRRRASRRSDADRHAA